MCCEMFKIGRYEQYDIHVIIDEKIDRMIDMIWIISKEIRYVFTINFEH